MSTAHLHPPDELRRAAWRTSTRSQTSNCVEVAPLGGRPATAAAVRDSKDRDGPALIFPRTRWQDFIAALRDGDFDLHR